MSMGICTQLSSGFNMKNISDILGNKHIKVETHKRPINPTWEQAKEFGDYIGINTLFVLRLFKIYGKEKVLAQRSWLKDAPKGKEFNGLVVWKMKQG